MSKKKQPTPEARYAVTTGAGKTAGPAFYNSMVNWLLPLVAILPVLFSSTTQDPMICSRYIFLGVFLLVFTAYFFIYRKTPLTFPASPLVLLVFAAGLLYAVWAVVSMFTAINPREGIYELARHLLNLLLLLVVMLSVQAEEGALYRLFKVLVVVVIFHSGVGILQYYDIGFTSIPGDNDNPFGLMANRNLFASALMLLFPFVLFVLYNGSRAWKITAAVAAALVIWALLLAQTRADWLALAAIFITSFSLLFIFSKTNRSLWLKAGASLASGIVMIVLLALAFDTEGKLKQSVSERIKSFANRGITEDANKMNAEERILFWRKTIALIKDKPFTGCGNNNWRIAIPAYGSEGMAEAYGKFAPDRAHNIYLQITSENGLPGALFYFSMWCLIAFTAIKLIVQTKNETQRILIILMLSALVGLAVDAVFSFPNERIEHSVFMYLVAGIILGHYLVSKVGEKKFIIYRLVVVLFILVCLINIFVGFKRKDFEEHWMLASSYESQGRYPEMLEAAEAGKNSLITLTPTGLPMELKTAAALQEMKQYDRALVEINKAIQYNPNSAIIYNYRGTLHAKMGHLDAALPDFIHARKLTPKFGKALKNLAMAYYLLKQYRECLATLDEIDISNDSYLLSVRAKAQAALQAETAQ